MVGLLAIASLATRGDGSTTAPPGSGIANSIGQHLVVVGALVLAPIVLVGGGALLVEVVFGLPGVGLLTYQSLISLDLPVIMATVIYGAIFIVFANALVDVAYAWLDPRVRPA